MVNGVPFFAKGACWIPADTFAPHLKYEDYADLIKSAADANMNMLRVWGGGFYEDDIFYDLCDELGICVWQDFMFACATYPTFDDAFMENVSAESEDNIRRLRHHPCIALWCGNNEMEQGWVGDEWNDRQMSWEDYAKFSINFCRRLSINSTPNATTGRAAPIRPIGDRNDFNNPQWGDAHLWDVWHGKKPFEWYRTAQHRFCSEFGFQSFPEPKTVYGYTAPQDRNITSYVMEHHQRSGIGNTTIMTYLLDWFRLPDEFETHALVEPDSPGHGDEICRRALAAEHAAHHGHAVLAVERLLAGRQLVFYRLSSPLESAALHGETILCAAAGLRRGRYRERHRGNLHQQRPDGALLPANCPGQSPMSKVKLFPRVKKQVEIKRGSRRVNVLNMAKYIKQYGVRNLMVWLELSVKGKTVSTNFVTFARPKHLELCQPDIKAEISLAEGNTVVTLTSKAPALWTWLELTGTDARFSDNFFHLRPDKPVKITITTQEPLSAGRNQEKSAGSQSDSILTNSLNIIRRLDKTMGFRKDFVWGVATAAYQIEGAAHEDGKGLSDWDIFCRKEGNVWNGQSGDIACDHYHHYQEDIDIMKQIGVNAYRMSISWPRVIPNGTGAVNQKGLAFYDKLIDELLEAGITPYVTLFHWDYPYELTCRGGWLNPDSSDWFAEYAKVVVEKLSDRVKNWMTINEPQVFINHGHHVGTHAPGL